MRILLAIAHQLADLFVDDGPLALLIIAWVAIVWFVLPELEVWPLARCAALFLGLALILTESSVRQARRR